MVSMLENMKDFGGQVVNKTNSAVDEVKKWPGDIAHSAVVGVKKGAGEIANKAAEGVKGAGEVANKAINVVKKGTEEVAHKAVDMFDNAHESAVRTSTSQMCRMLEIAIEELKTRPLLLEKQVSLTAIVATPIATLQMQIHLQHVGKENEGNGDVIVLPKTA